MAGYALPAAWEEEQVVASCRTGASDSLDLLYRQYAPALIAFCRNRLGANGDAEDAAHEAILKAHRALPRFREGAPLWPWLSTIAANVCTDIQRSRNRFESEGDAASAAAGDNDPARSAAPGLDETVTRRVRASIVSTALEELPERFRTPLVMRELMGLSYDEIAAASNKTVASVRTTLMRARRVFRARVEDVARRQGQWPLPAAVAGGLRRARDAVRQWRHDMARAGGDVMNAVCRAEGALQAGLQMAAVAAVTAGTALGGGGMTPVAHGATGAIAHPASPTRGASVALSPTNASFAVRTAGGSAASVRPPAAAPAGRTFAMHPSTAGAGDTTLSVTHQGTTATDTHSVTLPGGGGVAGDSNMTCHTDAADDAACPAWTVAFGALPNT
jgi:RNA polymerase sigma-70 factor (ECF subfamily)